MKKQHVFGFCLAIAIFLIGTSLNPFAANTTEFHWGLKKSVNGEQPDAGSTLNTMLAKYGAVYKDTPDEKVIYMTFDNGYENGYTAPILKTLKEEQVPATFFLTGHYLTSATPLVKQMIADGHTIGNHSYDHPNMATLNAAEMEKEWKRFDQKLYELTGVERTYYARPPEGIFNEQLLKVGQSLSYRHIFWSVAFIDWYADKPKGHDYAYNELMNQLHPGAIILMHTVSSDNAEALPTFIAEAKKQGYTFRSIDDLIFSIESKNENF